MNEQQAQPRYVKQKVAMQMLGVNGDTLRRWSNANKIPSIRTEGGTRLYNVDQYLQQRMRASTNSATTNISEPTTRPVDQSRIIAVPKTTNTPVNTRTTFVPTRKYCYCRVNSESQKDDLQAQIEEMQSRYPEHIIISDIGSATNWNRKGLRQLLDHIYEGSCKQIVVTNRYKVCRFAFELLEWIFQKHQVELVVLNEGMEASEPTELAEDLFTIIDIFSKQQPRKAKVGCIKRRRTEKEKTEGECNEEDNKTDTKLLS
jgi:putative resolvase